VARLAAPVPFKMGSEAPYELVFQRYPTRSPVNLNMCPPEVEELSNATCNRQLWRESLFERTRFVERGSRSNSRVTGTETRSAGLCALMTIGEQRHSPPQLTAAIPV
jgi:hypothetical protein